MRVNSYNKFFAEVAKIMNTEVKSVKQLDGRYKVELTNHVCLNVYRGVSGSLFIHDHREIARITSCYDFDDFKTLKDLYERLITDYSESTNEEDCIENAECARGNDVFDGCKQKPPKGHIYIDTDSVKVAPLPEQQTSEQSIKDTIIADDAIAYQNARVKETKKSVLDVMQCMMCSADREGNRCGGKQWCKQTWKRYDAIVNPEWHHVSITMLANIDNDMLDEKRRNYMYLYNLIKDFRKYAFEITRKDVYFETASNVFRNIQQLYFNNVISFTTYDYAAKHIQTVGVEKGWFDSKSEETFGYKESRRYKVTLR